MDILTAEFFERLLNISGVCLWGITMLYLMRQKGRGMKGNSKRDKLNAACERSFDEEVFAQLVKQQSEDAFKRINRVIRTERALLTELIENDKFNKIGDRRRKKDAVKAHDFPYQLQAKKKIRIEKKPKDVYAEVIRLSAQGMNEKKISEKVKLPKGEIEMLIKFRKKKQQSRKIRSARGA